MNRIEFWLMNNPIRAFIQGFEARKLRKMSDLPSEKVVLEIGCGQGVGTKYIQKYFEPKSIRAIDLDPQMVKRAKRRVRDPNITFEVGDASDLSFKDASFDAIFDFGIIHHIPNWEDSLRELYRVLKPDGQLILEDLSIETFEKNFLGKLIKPLLKHPYDQMYKRQVFYSTIKKVGFKVVKKYENSFWFSLVAQK